MLGNPLGLGDGCLCAVTITTERTALLNRGSSPALALLIDGCQGLGLVPEQLNDLRSADALERGRPPEVVPAGVDEIERLGKQGGIIHMAGVDREGLVTPTSGRPKRTRTLRQIRGLAVLDRQADSQPLERNALIIGGRPPLPGTSPDAGGPMNQLDMGLDLVAPLPARTPALGTQQVALLEQ